MAQPQVSVRCSLWLSTAAEIHILPRSTLLLPLSRTALLAANVVTKRALCAQHAKCCFSTIPTAPSTVTSTTTTAVAHTQSKESFPRRSPRWSRQEQAILLEKRDAGFSPEEISNLYLPRRSPRACYRMYFDLKTFETREQQQQKDSAFAGETEKVTADSTIERQPKQVEEVTFGAAPRWTRQELELLDQLVSKKVACKIISAQYFPHRSVAACRSMRNRIESNQFSKSHEWTAEDDELLVKLVTVDKCTWKEISKKHFPHLDPIACQRHYDTIVGSEKWTMGRWNILEDEKLLDAMLKQLNIDLPVATIEAGMKKEKQGEEVPGNDRKCNVRKKARVLKESLIGRELVPWEKVSRQMGGTRSANQCYKRFHSLAVPTVGRWTDAETDALLEALKEHGRNWNAISNIIQTRTSAQIQQKSHQIMNGNSATRSSWLE